MDPSHRERVSAQIRALDELLDECRVELADAGLGVNEREIVGDLQGRFSARRAALAEAFAGACWEVEAA